MIDYLLGLIDKLWWGLTYAIIWLILSLAIGSWRNYGSTKEANDDHTYTPGRRP